MAAQHCAPASSKLALQLVGEQQIGELALRVGGPLPVAALPLQVVEADPPEPVRTARHGDDARGRSVRAAPGAAGRSARSGRGGWCRAASRSRRRSCARAAPSRRHCCRARRSAGGGRRARRRPRGPRPGSPGRAPAATRARPAARRTDPRDRRLALRPVTAGEHDLGTAGGEGARRLEAEAAVRSRDHHGLAVDAGDALRNPTIRNRSSSAFLCPEL
jgi:hypothetical protein